MLVCLQCNNSFESDFADKKYCTESCARRARKQRQRNKFKEFRCIACDKLFSGVAGSTVKKFCSLDCRRIKNPLKTETLVPCPTCGQTFKFHYHKTYCSFKCHPPKPKELKQCQRCGIAFPTNRNQKYCSKKCSTGAQSVIYFLIGKSTQKLKVGISTRLEVRLSSIRRGNFDDVEVLGTIPGDFTREQEIHQELEPYHSHYEFYNYSPEVKAIVDRLLTPSEEF